MLTFNEYFGYRESAENPSKRRLKRTEISSQKLGESIELKKSNKKNGHRSNYLSKPTIPLMFASRSPYRTLKSSPFRSVSKRSFNSEQKSLKPTTKFRMTEQTKPMYERFTKEDCKTKAFSVQQKKDSLIINFIMKKQKDEFARKNMEPDNSSTHKIKYQINKKKPKSGSQIP